MDAFCDICGKQWDMRDPGVRFWYATRTWECSDEGLCFERASMNRLIAEVEQWPAR